MFWQKIAIISISSTLQSWKKHTFKDPFYLDWKFEQYSVKSYVVLDLPNPKYDITKMFKILERIPLCKS